MEVPKRHAIALNGQPATVVWGLLWVLRSSAGYSGSYCRTEEGRYKNCQ